MSISNLYVFQPFWSLLHMYVCVQSLYIPIFLESTPCLCLFPISIYIPTSLESTPYLCLSPISVYSNLSGVYSISVSVSNLYIVQPFWSLLHIYVYIQSLCIPTFLTSTVVWSATILDLPRSRLGHAQQTSGQVEQDVVDRPASLGWVAAEGHSLHHHPYMYMYTYIEREIYIYI